MRMFIAILMLPVHFLIDMYGRMQEHFRAKCVDCGGNLIFISYDEKENVAVYGCLDCGRRYIE